MGKMSAENYKIICLLLFVTVSFEMVSPLNNGLGLTPQMGWNSWNYFHCFINEDIVNQTAYAMVKTGLHSLGYQYVNVDDCWAGNRTTAGYITPDSHTFPHMLELIESVHSLGLKFGLYSSAGTRTCAGRPGSLGYETKDAFTYAAWGVDYFKYDHCNHDGHDLKTSYTVMRDALNSSGRAIFYSLCDGHDKGVAKWSGPIGNSWRTTKDIRDDWFDMINRIHLNNQWWKFAGPGGWNDPDMLEVGNGFMTTVEDTTHFSLWSIAKAPLLIGCDIRNISKDTLEILSNSEVIAINQDKLGVQGHVVWKNEAGDLEVWSCPLMRGDIAMLLLNMRNESVTMTTELSVVGVKSAMVRDLWLHKDLGEMKNTITAKVESHGVAMFRLVPTALDPVSNSKDTP